ncbi:MAG: hypothetical protein PUG55_05165 [Bacillales bacterium]|nr:hypothetical protein [Bacillales bacterium]
MGKKNIFIVLLTPFIISLFSMTIVNATFNIINNDILSISWDYKDVEAFKINNNDYRLNAVAVNDMNYPVPNSKLLWTVNNVNEDEENHAEINYKGNIPYLKTLSEGEVNIMVTNEKGNIFRKMKAIIYENAAITINPIIKSSQTNINPVLHVGEYNLEKGKRPTHHNVVEKYEVNIVPEYFSDKVILTHSSNIAVSDNYENISILGSGDAFVQLEFSDPNYGKTQRVEFNIVKDGINVYSYEDLLNCTNYSNEGEKVVLRTNFESSANLYVYDENKNIIGKKLDNTVQFGNFDLKTKNHTFNDEIYKFKTTYNHEYLDQWNNFADKTLDYNSIPLDINCGLHVQKDFYGNGYTINLHDLTYPYDSSSISSNGQTYLIPTLNKNNIFRGPLPFYVLGSPDNIPIIGAYGQDNIGMYVDGDNIIIDDINLKNCDFGNNLANLQYTGTVLETLGRNITVSNSRIQNGKNVVKCYSSDTNIDNCLLSYSQNFLLLVGSNKYVQVDGNKRISIDYNGQNYITSIEKLLERGGQGDLAMNNYILGDIDEQTINMMNVIQKAFDYFSPTEIDSNININNTLFYTSGITSIALETMFNGPFLYSASPSLIKDLLVGNGSVGQTIVPYSPTHIACASYPNKITLSGKTRFYDYKDADNYDLSGLIINNIDTIVNSIDPNKPPIDIDDIFPLKPLIKKQTDEFIYNNKINIPIAYYGGGNNNNSIVEINNLEDIGGKQKNIEADFFKEYLSLGKSDIENLQGLRNVMLKCVTIVTGINPFKFILANDYLLNKEPQIQTLIDNNKGDTNL